MRTQYILLWLLFLPFYLFGSNEWTQLAPGLELLTIKTSKQSSEGDSKIIVIRVDPHLWELVFAGISQLGERLAKTAKEWCENRKLTLAINAGMFGTDGETHVGYLKFRDHLNSTHVNFYKSVLAFDPNENKSVRPFEIFDLDANGLTMQSILNDYKSVAQNLRLIKKPGINVWPQQDRMWSEAAIGEDKEGRILFIYSRSPFSMHDFNEELLNSGIGIVSAQHVEGGPEAQLYLHAGDFEIEMFGSFETSYIENNSNAQAWPIPNVLGIKSKTERRDD